MPRRRIASRSEWSSSRMSIATAHGAGRDAEPAFGCHVRGSSVGTSARCARSTITVGLPAARQRSHGPDISRAVGQRRLSATSQAAMLSVKASSVVEIAGERDVATETVALDVAAKVVVFGHRAGQEQVSRLERMGAWRRTRRGSGEAACRGRARRSSRTRPRRPRCRDARARGGRRRGLPRSTRDARGQGGLRSLGRRELRGDQLIGERRAVDRHEPRGARRRGGSSASRNRGGCRSRRPPAQRGRRSRPDGSQANSAR